MSEGFKDERARQWSYGDLKPPRLNLPVWGMVSFGLIFMAFFADEWGVSLKTEWPPLVVDFFRAITTYGEAVWYLVPTGLLLIFLYLRRRDLRGRRSSAAAAQGAAVAGLIFAAVAFTGIVSDIGKYGFGRARPDVDPGGLWSFVGPTLKASYAAFPSGHSTTMGTFAILAIVLLPRKWAIPAVLFSLLVMASRVVIGVHHVSDAVAGYLLGLWGGWWVIWVFARLQIAVRPVEGVLPRRRAFSYRVVAREIWGLVPDRLREQVKVTAGQMKARLRRALKRSPKV